MRDCHPEASLSRDDKVLLRILSDNYHIVLLFRLSVLAEALSFPEFPISRIFFRATGET
jgi:hypothetical protein